MSIFKNEQVAEIWNLISEGNLEQAIANIDAMHSQVEEQDKKKISRMIDLLAKRSRQYGHQVVYLSLLEKNATTFPDDAQVHSRQALGFWETNDIEAAKSTARKALAIDPRSTLAMEILK